MEYESVMQKVLLGFKIKTLNYSFIFRNQFYFIVSGLKIIGHGNTGNNLELHCINRIIDFLVIINRPVFI
jgi:hypothetical protein